MMDEDDNAYSGGLDYDSCDSDGTRGDYSTMGGWSTVFEDEDQVELFDEEDDAVACLEELRAQHVHEPEDAVQQFEIVGRQRRVAKRRIYEDTDEEELLPRKLPLPRDPMEQEEDPDELREKFEESYQKIGPRRGRNRRRRRRKVDSSSRKEVPEEISKEMAEATLLFACNKFTEAKNMCMSIIRQCPNYGDAYHTMGMIINAEGNPRRAIDFYMVAAHFTPKDVTLWKQLAGLSTEVGYMRQAIYCLTHVVRRDRNDIDCQWDRALLYAEVGELRRAAEAFEAISEVRVGDKECIKMLSKLYHRMGRVGRAIKVLESFLMQFQPEADLTIINLLTALYVQQGNYTDAATLIDQAEHIILRGDPLPIDLQVQAGICAAHVGNLLEADRHLNRLLEENPKHHMDLYLDVGNHFLQLGFLDRAMEFYEALLKIPDANGAQLWQPLAECRMKMGGKLAVARMYKEAVEIIERDHPEYLEGCLLLMENLVEVEDLTGAQQVLELVKSLLKSEEVILPAENREASAILFRMEQVEFAVEKEETSFLDRMLPVVAQSIRHLKKSADNPEEVKLPEEFLAALSRKRQKRNVPDDSGMESDAIFKGHRNIRQQMRYQRQMSEGETDNETLDNELLLKGMLSQDDQFQMLGKVIDALVESDRISEAIPLIQSIIKVAGATSRACNKKYRDLLRLRLVGILGAENRIKEALEHLKIVCSRYPHSIQAWNEFCRVTNRGGPTKWQTRFVESLRKRYPTSVPVKLMMGHVLTHSGQFLDALGEYLAAYRDVPNDPLTLLLLGVTYINCSITSRASDGHNMILKGCSFLDEYKRKRSNPQESHYNFGRAYHQLGLFHIAVKAYEQCLKAEAPPGVPCIKREAAHNLVLIYKATGAKELARRVMQENLTI
ncbi:hypothetical protein BSKO_13884 [Bryopsis sp. KO-2023]|nr:hypothetical protein BSKO_13884 [Bryopsis sp. KO-2023]